MRIWFFLTFTLVPGYIALAAERLNVVLIIADDQGWGDFGFMGHPVIKTPNLDKLASQSVTYIDGYVPTALCRPSLATMLTGLYPHQHKICWNDPPKGVDRNSVLHFVGDLPTIPRLLGQAGYVSLQTGKFWEGRYSNAGFTDGMSLNEAHGRHGDEGLHIGRDTMKPIYNFIEGIGKRTSLDALHGLEAHGKEHRRDAGATPHGQDARATPPFFIWYAPMMPHEPHNPPERILKKYRAPDRPIELAKYWGMCEWFDETVGELLAFLDKEGLRENTLVLFVVDNGWIQNVTTRPTIPGQAWSRGFALKSKQSPYDGGLRTPILIRWPGHIKPQRREDLVSTIDFAPTILSACGVTPDAGMKGINLVDLAGGQAAPHDAVFGDVYAHTAVSADNPADSLTHRWMRQGEWKLIWPVKGDLELYNLREDPHEEKNLADKHPDRVAELKKRLADWWNPAK